MITLFALAYSVALSEQCDSWLSKMSKAFLSGDGRTCSTNSFNHLRNRIALIQPESDGKHVVSGGKPLLCAGVIFFNGQIRAGGIKPLDADAQHTAVTNVPLLFDFTYPTCLVPLILNTLGGLVEVVRRPEKTH